NPSYWRRGEYLALGPGACGFVGDVRYANVKPVARYTGLLDADTLPIDTTERLTAAQALGEQLFLGLRTSDGVVREVLDARLARAPALRQPLDGCLAASPASAREPSTARSSRQTRASCATIPSSSIPSAPVASSSPSASSRTNSA